MKLKKIPMLKTNDKAQPLLVPVQKSEKRLCLGIEYCGKNRRRVVILVRKGEKIQVIDRLFFNEAQNEYTTYPFSWTQFRGGRYQSRGSVRLRLKSMGFNPKIVDDLYPQYGERANRIETVEECQLYLGVAVASEGERNRLIAFTRNGPDASEVEGFNRFVETTTGEVKFREFTTGAIRTPADVAEWLAARGFDRKVIRKLLLKHEKW